MISVKAKRKINPHSIVDGFEATEKRLLFTKTILIPFCTTSQSNEVHGVPCFSYTTSSQHSTVVPTDLAGIYWNAA